MVRELLVISGEFKGEEGECNEREGVVGWVEGRGIRESAVGWEAKSEQEDVLGYGCTTGLHGLLKT